MQQSLNAPVYKATIESAKCFTGKPTSYSSKPPQKEPLPLSPSLPYIRGNPAEPRARPVEARLIGDVSPTKLAKTDGTPLRSALELGLRHDSAVTGDATNRGGCCLPYWQHGVPQVPWMPGDRSEKSVSQ
ncbi:hypothetical protein MTO96_037840, partial [Rhipicephalus appendiculatus]